MRVAQVMGLAKREVAVHIQLNGHPNIVHLRGAYRTSSGRPVLVSGRGAPRERGGWPCFGARPPAPWVARATCRGAGAASLGCLSYSARAVCGDTCLRCRDGFASGTLGSLAVGMRVLAVDSA
jgi:hypothetical protein